MSCVDVMPREQGQLDITRLRDDSLEDLDSLPPPEVMAREIVEEAAALTEFGAVAVALGSAVVGYGHGNGNDLERLWNRDDRDH